MTALHKYIHPSVLPQEYGGELPPSDCTEIVDKLLESDEEWKKDMKYGFRSQISRCKNEEDDHGEMVNNEESCAA